MSATVPPTIVEPVEPTTPAINRKINTDWIFLDLKQTVNSKFIKKLFEWGDREVREVLTVQRRYA